MEVAEDQHYPIDPDGDTVTYPTGLKLAIITLALALAVFLVALVS